MLFQWTPFLSQVVTLSGSALLALSRWMIVGCWCGAALVIQWIVFLRQGVTLVGSALLAMSRWMIGGCWGAGSLPLLVVGAFIFLRYRAGGGRSVWVPWVNCQD